jgi:hypothetical protein
MGADSRFEFRVLRLALVSEPVWMLHKLFGGMTATAARYYPDALSRRPYRPTTFPTIFFSGTKPQLRESLELSRLSPST